MVEAAPPPLHVTRMLNTLLCYLLSILIGVVKCSRMTVHTDIAHPAIYGP